MKKILSVLFAVILRASIVSVGASAAKRHVIDNTGTMTSSQIAQIEATCKTIKQEYSFDVIYVITNTIGGKSLERYTTDIYDEECEFDDGVIFVFNTEEFGYEDEENWAMIGFGKGKKLAGNEDTRAALINQMASALKSGRYYDASSYFTNKCRSFCDGGFKGDPKDPGKIIIRIVIGLAVGLFVGLSVTKKEKKKLTTAVKQKGALGYMMGDKSSITVSRDIFLYSHTTKVRRESSSSGGRSYGGTSGGGRSYSGGGGRI